MSNVTWNDHLEPRKSFLVTPRARICLLSPFLEFWKEYKLCGRFSFDRHKMIVFTLSVSLLLLGKRIAIWLLNIQYIALIYY